MLINLDVNYAKFKFICAGIGHSYMNIEISNLRHAVGLTLFLTSFLVYVPSFHKGGGWGGGGEIIFLLLIFC